MITWKTSVNTARYSTGLASDQTKPRVEPLYLTLRSLRTRLENSSQRILDWAAARASAVTMRSPSAASPTRRPRPGWRCIWWLPLDLNDEPLPWPGPRRAAAVYRHRDCHSPRARWALP